MDVSPVFDNVIVDLQNLDQEPAQDRVPVFDINNVHNVDDVFVDCDDLCVDDNVCGSYVPKLSVFDNQSSSSSNIYSQAFSINPSPLKPHVFRQYLKGYNKFDKAQLLHNLEFGIRVPSSIVCDMSLPIPDNHASAIRFKEPVQKMISKSLENGWVAGPYDCRPVDLIVSPLASVPKKDTGVRRVIHNLSFPLKNSVNSHIPRHFCTVSYENIDDCVNIIAELGPGALIAKGDIKDAFYSL